MARDETLRTAIRDYCVSTAGELNRNYVVTVLTKDALDRHYGTFQKRKRANVKVVFPSSQGGIIEKQTEKAVIAELLQRSLDFDIYKHSLIAAVSAVEDLLSNILRSVLQRFPERLNASVTGEKLDKSIELNLVLESNDLEELRNRLVERRLLKIFYESPQKYFEHFTSITGFKVPTAEQDNYVEVKATRDVLIHNRGIVNEKYLEKAGVIARGQLDEEIPLTSKYFGDSIANLKKFLIAMIREARKVYGVRSPAK